MKEFMQIVMVPFGVMPKISMCGNDLELAPGFCGTISGSVNVTVGQPHIKVDSITVGGR